MEAGWPCQLWLVFYSLKAERSCVERSKTKALYVNLCTNEVKKIRELKCNAANGAASEETSAVITQDTTKQTKFYQTMAKYKITKVRAKFAAHSATLSSVSHLV